MNLFCDIFCNSLNKMSSNENINKVVDNFSVLENRLWIDEKNIF